MFGVLLAILIVLNLRNGMGLLNITGEIQTGVIGLLLIFSVLGPNIGRGVREAWSRRRGVQHVPLADEENRKEADP